jgi:hypothetical protein
MIDPKILEEYVAEVRRQRADQKLEELQIIERRLEFEKSIVRLPRKKVNLRSVP